MKASLVSSKIEISDSLKTKNFLEIEVPPEYFKYLDQKNKFIHLSKLYNSNPDLNLNLNCLGLGLDLGGEDNFIVKHKNSENSKDSKNSKNSKNSENFNFNIDPGNEYLQLQKKPLQRISSIQNCRICNKEFNIGFQSYLNCDPSILSKIPFSLYPSFQSESNKTLQKMVKNEGKIASIISRRFRRNNIHTLPVQKVRDTLLTKLLLKVNSNKAIKSKPQSSFNQKHMYSNQSFNFYKPQLTISPSKKLSNNVYLKKVYNIYVKRDKEKLNPILLSSLQKIDPKNFSSNFTKVQTSNPQRKNELKYNSSFKKAIKLNTLIYRGKMNLITPKLKFSNKKIKTNNFLAFC